MKESRRILEIIRGGIAGTATIFVSFSLANKVRETLDEDLHDPDKGGRLGSGLGQWLDKGRI